MLRFDTPKNDKARMLDVDASTMKALRATRERQIGEGVSDVGQLVFRRPMREGFQPWRPDVTTHVFQRLSAEAGVPVVPFHYLRHSCASWLLGAGLERGRGKRTPRTLEPVAHALGVRARDPGPSARACSGDRRGTEIGETILT